MDKDLPHPLIQQPVRAEPSQLATRPGCSREGNSRFFTKTGQWTLSEKQKYLLFLLYHQSLFEQGQGHLFSLFKGMAKCIASRKPNQCRLYHRKMEKYYQSVDNIVRLLSASLHPCCPPQPLPPCPIQLSPQKFSSIEECSALPPNNGQEPPSGHFRREEKKEVSIKMGEEQQELLDKEQDLPKTDRTIAHVSPPFDLQHPHIQHRTSFLSLFQQEEPVPPKELSRTAGDNFVLELQSRAGQTEEGWERCQNIFGLWLRSLETLAEGGQL